MIFSNEKISIRQLQSLLALYFFGSGVLYLPRIAAEHAGRDGWVSVVIAALLAVISCSIIVTLALSFPGQSFHDYAGRLVSKPVGKIFCAALAAKVIVNCALELRVFGEVVGRGLLPSAPIWVLSGVMLLLGGLVSVKGYETRGRTAEILVFLVFVPLIILLIAASFKIDFKNLLPVFEAPPKDILLGGLSGGYVFGGIELLLVALPFINGKKTGRRAVLAVFSIGVFMAVVTLIVIARFSPSGTRARGWPLLELLCQTDMPGAFMERLDALVMSFWILTAFAAVSAGLFFPSLLLKDAVGRGRRGLYIAALIPAIGTLSCLPKDVYAALEYIQKLYRYAEPVFALILPLLLLIVARIRGVKKSEIK